MPAVEYEVIPADLCAHLLRVACTVATPAAEGQCFAMPAWVPGSYLIREFARHVLAVAARDGAGQPVALTKLDKQTWRAAPCAGPLTVTCEIHARDESVRGAYLDTRRGFFDGASVFLRAVGHEQDQCRLRLRSPAGARGWQAVTTMPALKVHAAGFGDYRAADYFELIDHPVAMGEAVECVEFDAAGVPHAFVLLGRHDADTKRLAADLAKLCAAQAAFFGALPVPRYLFLAQLAAAGFGGLEHRDCAALTVARGALPTANHLPDAYTDLLGLCSHEYFHLWNVKRIKPAAVVASDLSAEAHFADLWAYEGVTSYYDDLMLVRAGLLAPAAYLERLARGLTRLQRNPGRQRQSLAESSFDAWTKFYRPTENSPNAIVSYYGKGALVALALDLTLRRDTGGRCSLDTVMQAAWQRYGAAGEPVPENGLERLAIDASGLDLGGFFDACVRGTEDPDFRALLRSFGVRAVRIPAEAKDSAAALLGQGLRLAPGKASVNHVLAGSAAEAAGLCPGDTLVAANGWRVDADSLAARLRRTASGDSLALHVFRDEELLQLELTPVAPAPDVWRLTPDPDADAGARNARHLWLHGRPPDPAP